MTTPAPESPTAISLCKSHKGTRTHINSRNYTGIAICNTIATPNTTHDGDYADVLCKHCRRRAERVRVSCEGCATLTADYKRLCDDCRAAQGLPTTATVYNHADVPVAHRGKS